MSSEPLVVNKLFADSGYFLVPEYQRAYAWEKKQITDFFKDIEEYSRTNTKTKYLFGQIIINKTEETTKDSSGDDTTVIIKRIVDGQQRLATLTIAMCILRDKIKTAISTDPSLTDKFEEERTNLNNCIGFKNKYKLVMGSSNKDFFEHFVQSSEKNYEVDTLNKRVKQAYELLSS